MPPGKTKGFRSALKGASGPHLAPGLAKKPGQMPPGQYKHMLAGTGPYKPGGPKAPATPPTTSPIPGHPAQQTHPAPQTHPGASTTAPVKPSFGQSLSPTPATKPALAAPSLMPKPFAARRLGRGPKAGRGFRRPGFKGKGRAFGRKRQFGR